jgi:hypothetical protein
VIAAQNHVFSPPGADAQAPEFENNLLHEETEHDQDQ